MKQADGTRSLEIKAVHNKTREEGVTDSERLTHRRLHKGIEGGWGWRDILGIQAGKVDWKWCGPWPPWHFGWWWGYRSYLNAVWVRMRVSPKWRLVGRSVWKGGWLSGSGKMWWLSSPPLLIVQGCIKCWSLMCLEFFHPSSSAFQRRRNKIQNNIKGKSHAEHVGHDVKVVSLLIFMMTCEIGTNINALCRWLHGGSKWLWLAPGHTAGEQWSWYSSLLQSSWLQMLHTTFLMWASL